MDHAEPKPIERVALACIQCRSRHVKCDATQPVCSRCKKDKKECTYHKSRRGGLDKAALARRRMMQQQQQQQQQQQADRAQQLGETSGQNASPDSSNSGDKDAVSIQYTLDADPSSVYMIEPQLAASSNMTFQISTDRLLDMFYENFWHAFPFILPHPYLNQRKLNENHGMDNLLPVLQWIGSVYAPWTPAEPYYEAARLALSSLTLPRDPWTVQALMLLAIGEHHWDLRPESKQTLDKAVTLALELQMNTKEFARAYGEMNPVLEESWRRTYYFLALVDQHFAVIINTPNFPLRDVPNLVDLPCEDELYISGQIPPTTTWQDYDMREFADVEIVYSSIIYMIDVSKIVTFIMRSFVQTGTFSDSLIAAVDAKVAAWRSLLPACKRDPMRRNGKIDEVMFQAHMMAAIVIMTSHRPFSSLFYSIEELSTEAFVSPVPFIEPRRQGHGTHTARVLRAIDIQTKLLAIPCAIERHSIFTPCMVATLATAQISACNVLLEDHALSIARDRVRLSIGHLNALGTIWPLAKKMAKEVRYIARRTLSSLPSLTTQEVDSSAEMEIPRDEVVWPVDPSAQIDIYAGIDLPVHWDAPMMNYSSLSDSSLP